MQDEDYVKEVLEFARNADDDYAPPGELYSPEVERLDALVDEMRLMRTEAISMRGGKPSTPKMQPRPRTAARDVEERESRETYDFLAAALLGDRA